MPIRFIEVLPVVAIDADGVGITACSGEEAMRFRMPRSLWRKYLETEIRRLNEWEIAERAERGRVIQMERRGHH